MPQKDFRLNLATSSLLTNTLNHSNPSTEDDEDVGLKFDRPSHLPRVDGEHGVVSPIRKKFRRCQIKAAVNQPNLFARNVMFTGTQNVLQYIIKNYENKNLHISIFVYLYKHKNYFIL